ncbi:MAG: zf-HC2 domain-containing protein [Planctomycetota bacterium]
MTCNEIQSRLHRYLDGELPPGEARRVERHLGECNACRRARREVESLNGLLDEAYGCEKAPSGFARRARRRAEKRQVAGIRWLAPVASMVGAERVRAAVAAVFLFAGLSAGGYLGWSTAAVQEQQAASAAQVTEQEEGAQIVGHELAAAPPGSLTEAYVSVPLESQSVDPQSSAQ